MKVFDDETDYYLPAFFSIYMNCSCPFKEIIGSEYEHGFLHEYVHFMQDVLTTYGVVNASHVLNNIKSVYHFVKDKEKAKDFILELPVDLDKVSNTNEILFRHYLQYTQTSELSLDEKIIDVKECQEKVQFPDGSIKLVSIYKVYFESGKTLNFGQHAMVESISHLLEKTIYNLSTDYYLVPYDLAQLVWNFYLPHEQNNIKALLELDEFSLQFYNPAEIFVKTLRRIEGGEIKITENFFTTLLNSWTSDKGENTDELYQKGITQLEEDINGVFVSPIYYPYKEWLLDILHRAQSIKHSGQPIFSSILCNYTKTTISKYITDMETTLGLPPVTNADGAIYVKGLINDSLPDVKMKSLVEVSTWTFVFLSFFSSLGVYSVYNLLLSELCINHECWLREVCMHYNELSKKGEELFDCDQQCIDSPELKRIKTQAFCPYAVVWQTFGLNNMDVI